MDNYQIDRVAKGNKITSVMYKGCYPANFLSPKYEEGFFIVNTSTKPNEMGHWLLFFNDGNSLNFFDSFGFHPKMYGGPIAKYFMGHRKAKIVTEHSLQNPASFVCGAYCIYFAYFMCKNLRHCDIISKFDVNNTRKNDKIVEAFVFSLTGDPDCCSKKYICGVLTFNSTCKKYCLCK